MKTLLPPIAAVVLSTALTVWSCHATGMPSQDLMIAGLVAFSVSATVAFGVVAFFASMQKRAKGPTGR